MRLHARLQRPASHAHQHAGPAVIGFERGRVDDPRAAGHGLKAPGPLAVKASGRGSQSEDGLGACLQALYPCALPEQSDPGPGGPGRRSGRPRRSRRSESKFRKEGLRRCGIMDRRPHHSWRCLDEDAAFHDSARSQVVARPAKPDLWIRSNGHQVTGRSGARPSSSPGRQRSIRGAQWPDRQANRSALQRRWSVGAGCA